MTSVLAFTLLIVAIVFFLYKISRAAKRELLEHLFKNNEISRDTYIKHLSELNKIFTDI